MASTAAAASRCNGAITALPATRKMSVVAQDPTFRDRGRILMATVDVPDEDLVPGPMGYRVQVVDYDSSAMRYLGAHQLPRSLEQEPESWRRGDPSIVNDHRFHAQNVYALVMKTLAHFERALGRRVGWSFRTHQLKVSPHGIMDANAFYSARDEGLVFGYFAGRSGRTVYSCLSHDVVVHETAHALIDALRERYLDPSSPDQAALHEGFADVIALLSVFSQPEVLEPLLRAHGRSSAAGGSIAREAVTAGALRESALLGLAEEMGQEMESVRGSALRRSAAMTADPTLLDRPEMQEEHRRGEVFVAAVMNGMLNAWEQRIHSLGEPGQHAYPIARVAEEGADIARALATMWIRALDYMPPVHVEFADALSAALTADLEARPDDTRFQLREHMRRTFRAYGIRPASAGVAEAGVWDTAPPDLSYDRVRFESMRSDKDEVFRFLWENRERLNLRPAAYTRVLTLWPCVRIGRDGFTLRETVATYYQVARLTAAELRQQKIRPPRGYLQALRHESRARQERRAPPGGGAVEAEAEAGSNVEAGDDSTTPLHGGGTLAFDEFGRLKYHIHNDVFGRRQSARLEHLWRSGLLRAGAEGARLRVSRLSDIHRLRALESRRFPGKGW